MAYITGTAADMYGVLAALRAAAAASGWLTDFSQGNDTWIFHSADSSQRYSLRVTSNTSLEGGGNLSNDGRFPAGQGIWLFGNSAYDSGQNYKNQPGNSIANYGWDSSYQNGQSYAALMACPSAGPFTYWLYVTASYVHLVVEGAGVAANTRAWRHLSLGTLDKKGMTYDGGQYAVASTEWFMWNPYEGVTIDYVQAGLGRGGVVRSRVRVNGIDGLGQEWVPIQGLGAGRFSDHFDAGLAQASANDFTGDTNLVPNRILYMGKGGRPRYLGDTPDFAIVSMMYCNPGDILVLGAEEWQVFPALVKGLTGRYGYVTNNRLYMTGSADVGYAYRLRR